MTQAISRLALLLLLIASRSSFGLQSLEARDGETLLAKISRKEVTRIAVEHEHIRKVTGNAGEFVLEKDDDSGQIFIRPASPESTKPINLYVTTATDTIALLLQPVDTPSDTILLRPKSQKQDMSPVTLTGATHVRRLKNLLLVMATDAHPDNVEIESLTELRNLWPGTRLVLTRRWHAPDVIGERYSLANTGATSLSLEAPRFFKVGVMAVSIEQPLLMHGASTSLFVIREAGHDD